ncbi:catechol 2,3-dioxygenase-like lactoylglutathione lyase family enzyme [Hoeflea marina]|uniref:Catechol 2,3-dioxygenase-like lactoylglutathione lyase family enzyme n=1 Tax=Hoeflea marina TaxID=274592 RepID=A0A317PR27_9HYPH|nr:VOC family protein [Hoeflea marina]PWW03941.1 catechol 2,3-dioxygenase-like lactoylglutathione lyase family enzyme [Hoeflea marina]
MSDFNFVLQYVADPAASAVFYSGFLDSPVIESSDSFCMLPLGGGVMLGLWKQDTVEPAPESAPGGNEIGFGVSDAAAVDAMYTDWLQRGVKMAQVPTTMDFGRTFVALDPDGHRLRVFSRPAK